MNHAETRRPEEIQAEIDRTRGDMDATLRAIEQRLNPRHLMNQGVDYLRNSGGKEFVSNLGGSVKDNPLPVTLVGIGLAWLMAATKGAGTGTSDARLSTQKLSGSAQAATEKLGSTAQAARQRASQLGESARHRVQQARGRYDRIVQEQPLALGAVGLAIGAMLAASVPRTRIDEMKPEASTPEMPPKPKITVGIVETGPL